MVNTKRAGWKGPFLKQNFLEGIKKSTAKRLAKTTSRASVILPVLLSKRISVYNGKYFLPIHIVEDMLGHKVGEFVFTRKRNLFDNKFKNNSTKKRHGKSKSK